MQFRASISPDADPELGQGGYNIYETELSINLKDYYYVWLIVATKTQDLGNGTFSFTNKVPGAGISAGEILFCRVMHGKTHEHNS